MTCCEALHTEYDALANRDVQVGPIPGRMRVDGRVAWYVYQGPYREISAKGWDVFWRKFTVKNLKMEGAPGDLYICSPGCHKDDEQAKMLTILWAPLG